MLTSPFGNLQSRSKIRSYVFCSSSRFFLLLLLLLSLLKSATSNLLREQVMTSLRPLLHDVNYNIIPSGTIQCEVLLFPGKS